MTTIPFLRVVAICISGNSLHQGPQPITNCIEEWQIDRNLCFYLFFTCCVKRCLNLVGNWVPSSWTKGLRYSSYATASHPPPPPPLLTLQGMDYCKSMFGRGLFPICDIIVLSGGNILLFMYFHIVILHMITWNNEYIAVSNLNASIFINFKKLY